MPVISSQDVDAGPRRAVARLRVGDLLVFGRVGAHGWDISHHEFLRHDPPKFLVTG